jgi:hypothetical protein
MWQHNKVPMRAQRLQKKSSAHRNGFPSSYIKTEKKTDRKWFFKH